MGLATPASPSGPDRATGRRPKVSFSIRNVGKRPGKGVAQLYVAPADWKKAGWEAPKRLGAFAKADLKPGQSKRVEVTVDPRLLATYEAAGNNWHIRAGNLSPAPRTGVRRPDPNRTRVTLPDAVWSASPVSN